MQSVNDFYKLRDTEDFFEFFGLEFDQKLINIKRFHMMKEYGTLIKKGLDSISDENKLLEFLKFSLLEFMVTTKLVTHQVLLMFGICMKLEN